MDYDQFNRFCEALPATTHVVQWGGAHVWKVGGKVFAIGGWSQKDQNGNQSAAFTFKTSDLNFQFLSDHEGYIPAPYFASRGMKWIQQVDTQGHLDEELTYYLTQSYQLAAKGLSKRKREELGVEI